jgi:hypothetical protein
MDDGLIDDRVVYQIEESRSDNTCEAFCPELDIIGFGDTPEEAREALREQVSSYLQDCADLGILDEVLIEAGFYDNGESWTSNLVVPVGDPKITIFDSETGLIGELGFDE